MVFAVKSAPGPQEGRADAAGIQNRTDTTVRMESHTREPLVRQVINGRYRVVDMLGTGSLGTVYLCDEIPTAKRVAVKVFRREFAKDAEFMDCVRRQVKLAAASYASRPTILAVYDCGRTYDGSAYIATEYLQGRTLKDIIRRGGPLDVQRALRVGCQIAEGLDAIHNMGFVHTDVRSENVIVVMAGEEEVAKLKGFEVAGLRETALVGHLIRAGIIPSNPEYATPEQIEGDQVTARTDIYAFGVLLYEMLTGRVPFSASIPDAVLAKHLQEAPVPLSTFRQEIPSVVELRVKQALEKEPERRQRYIGDVVNEYLCELAADEWLAERARQRRGVIGKLAARVQSRLPPLRASPAEGTSLGLRWKVGVAAALLVALSVAAMWMFWPVQRPAHTAAPPRQRPLGVPAAERERPVGIHQDTPRPALPPVAADDVPGAPDGGVTTAELPKDTSDSEPTDVPAMRRDTAGPQPPTVPKESSLRPPDVGTRPQKSSRPPARVEAPVTGERQTAPARVAQPPSVSRQDTPTPARGAPDPTAIIDWLLGQPSVKQ
jgi:serine/threonine protein kinase